MPSTPDPAYQMAVATIGERVKKARKEIQLTQRELAKRLSISAGYLSDVENGQNKANADIIVGMIIFFPKLNSDWLLTGRGEMFIEKEEKKIGNKYDLDIEALKEAQELFFQALDPASGLEAARVVANGHYFINLMYRTYMTNLDLLLAQGVSEAEARSRARDECALLDERDIR